MNNTVQAHLQGVMEWATKGVHFVSSRVQPVPFLQEEQYELEALYSDASTRRPVHEVLIALVNQQVLSPLTMPRQQQQQQQQQQQPSQAHQEQIQGLLPLLLNLNKQGKLLGQGHSVFSSSAGDEECERELQREKEQEEELVKEVSEKQTGVWVS
jgi:hypothetical protein